MTKKHYLKRIAHGLTALFLSIASTAVMPLQLPVSAAPHQTTIIIVDNEKKTYDIGEHVTFTIGVSSPDGSYLKGADCGFGYNASTMRLITETDTIDHVKISQNTPAKWLYTSLEFEMKTNGKCYFIAGAYDGDGVIQGIRADGSRISCPRASVVYKIGTGIYTPTSDCNLESCSIINAATGKELNFNRAFDKNITEYWLEADASLSEILINAETENKDDTLVLPEDMHIGVGENTIKVGVQSVSGEIKDYIYHIDRPAELAIADDILVTDSKGKEYDYTYDPQVHTYDLIVDEDIDSVQFEAKTVGSTKVIYPEDTSLDPGYNEKTIILTTASDEQIYEYYIYRTPSELSLSSIVVETTDGTVRPLEEEFKPDTLEYSLNVPSDVKGASITVTTANKNDHVVEDLSSIKLEHGENVIPITVTDGVNKKIYQITINRGEALVFKEEAKEEKPKDTRNKKEHKGFQFHSLILLAAAAAVVFAGLLIFVVVLLVKEKKEYDSSEEAKQEHYEEERKKRLKQLEKEMHKKKH